MFNNFKSIFAICLLAFASMQSAQAMPVFSEAGAVAGTADAAASFVSMETFTVESGGIYKAMFTDVFSNFNSFSMTVLDENGIPELGSFLSFGSSDMFTFLVDSTPGATFDYKVIIAGESDFLSTYSATISAVPVPAAVWFFGSAMITLAGFGRRKTA